jgi:hypothetical protein
MSTLPNYLQTDFQTPLGFIPTKDMRKKTPTVKVEKTSEKTQQEVKMLKKTRKDTQKEQKLANTRNNLRNKIFYYGFILKLPMHKRRAMHSIFGSFQSYVLFLETATLSEINAFISLPFISYAIQNISVTIQHVMKERRKMNF